MTLDQLQQIQTQLKAQYVTLTTTSVPDDKLTLLHCNGIELRGGLQLLAQLILLEQAAAAAPPGATGPGIP